uniref:Thymosin beta n=1 Tax=Syphacia muris TaxID=451379 RepID=A0A0N5AZ06_9BILA
MSGEPISPTAKNFPRIPEPLAQAVVKGCPDLKHVETTEKNFLPKPHHVAAEKIDANLKEQIKAKDNLFLKPTHTVEKNVLPSSDDIAREKVPELITSFDSKSLNHIEPTVKTTLPSAFELSCDNVKKNIVSFDHNELNHVEPVVKTRVEVFTSESESTS